MRRSAVSSASGIGVVRLAAALGRSPPLPRPSIRTTTARAFHSKPADNNATAAAAAAKTTADHVADPAPPHRVTIAEIAERRAKAGRLVAMTAAYSQTDMFKGPSTGKPLAKRWDHHISSESASREPCVLKQAARHLKTPGILSLGGGLPCAEYFPFASLSAHVAVPPDFSESTTFTGGGRDISIAKYSASDPAGPVYDLAIALNYGQANGSAQLNRFCAEHTELVGAPPYADWRACLTVGSTAGLEQVLRMLVDRGRGDAVLTEEYSFATALETVVPMGGRVVGVPMDGEGLLPAAMERILEGWRPEERGGARRPHVLYTVPSGQNPTGAMQGGRRRREIYEVARRWDLVVVEDEPYYFLQMPEYGTKEGEGEGDVASFLEGLVPTYLSMDVDGRVVRLDSFSKVAVPGSRVGWVTASAQLIERYERHAEVANQGPSGFSQVLLWKLLDETWGHEGYFKWLMALRKEYTRRRDTLVGACEEWLPKEVCSWNGTRAGMFHWIRVDHTKHPGYPDKTILEMEEEIFDKCIAGGVLVARGSWFRAEHDKPPSGLFFRTTYAAATEENMVEATKRLGKVIREVYGL